MKWTKLGRGRYELSGTDYRVEAAYEATASDEHMARTGAETVAATEWAVVRISRDENLTWHDTMREAREEAERLAQVGAPQNPNERRADAAEEAVAIASDNEPGEQATSLSDTLASLRHYADRYDLDFDEINENARRAYQGDGEDGPPVRPYRPIFRPVSVCPVCGWDRDHWRKADEPDRCLDRFHSASLSDLAPRPRRAAQRLAD